MITLLETGRFQTILNDPPDFFTRDPFAGHAILAGMSGAFATIYGGYKADDKGLKPRDEPEFQFDESGRERGEWTRWEKNDQQIRQLRNETVPRNFVRGVVTYMLVIIGANTFPHQALETALKIGQQINQHPQELANILNPEIGIPLCISVTCFLGALKTFSRIGQIKDEIKPTYFPPSI